MAAEMINRKNAFDFSQDALMFRQRLWLKLKGQMAIAPAQLLDDNDLSLIYAAGMLNVQPDQDDLLGE